MEQAKQSGLFEIPRLALDYDEAAAALSISKPTLERMVAARQIPHVRIRRGGKPLIRFRPETIAAWLQEQETR